MKTEKNSRKERRTFASMVERIKTRLLEAQQRLKDGEVAVARARDRVEDLEDILRDAKKNSGDPDNG